MCYSLDISARPFRSIQAGKRPEEDDSLTPQGQASCSGAVFALAAQLNS